MAIELTGNPPFFANVFRCPELVETGPGCYRVRFWVPRAYLWESGVLVAICLAAGIWVFVKFRATLPFVALPFLPVAALAFVYVWIGDRIQRLEEERSIEIRDGELWVGTPELKRLGRIREVIVVSVPGNEDEWRDENGSERIYVRLEGCAAEDAVVPLVIGQIDLRPLAKRIAEVVGCPFRRGKGRGEVPLRGRGFDDFTS